MPKYACSGPATAVLDVFQISKIQSSGSLTMIPFKSLRETGQIPPVLDQNKRRKTMALEQLVGNNYTIF